MKKIFITLFGITILGFTSCNSNSDEIEAIESDISTIKDSLNEIENQNEVLLDSITTLINSSNTSVAEALQLERGNAIVELFESMARQPEASEELDVAATKFIGAFKVSQLTNDPNIDGTSRGIALSGLFVSIARQPEAFDRLESAATKFLGDYDSAIFNDDVIEVAKAFAISGLNESLARQPEAADLYNLITVKFLDFNFLEEEN